jgi:hypothetical protein
MAVDNYTTVEKASVEKMIETASKVNHITSAPIEHYSVDEIQLLAKLAKVNGLLLTIREERSNFYQGTLIQLIKKSVLSDETKVFLNHL